MSPVSGKVKDGVVRLERKGLLSEGQRVLVIPLPKVDDDVSPSPEIEQEDLEFVRGSKGRLARQLRTEDGKDA